jgi:hypothetical protein
MYDQPLTFWNPPRERARNIHKEVYKDAQKNDTRRAPHSHFVWLADDEQLLVPECQTLLLALEHTSA